MAVDPKQRNYWIKSLDTVAVTAGTPVEIRDPAEGKTARIMGWNISFGGNTRVWFHKSGGAFMPLGLCTTNVRYKQPPDFPGVTVPAAVGSGNGVDIVVNIDLSSSVTVDGFFWGYDE